MAKAGSVSRFLRNLLRAGKAQHKLISSLAAATAPGSAKRAATPGQKKSRQRKQILEVRPNKRPDVTSAPGKWTASDYADSQQSPEGHPLRLNYWLYIPDRIPAAVTRHGWPLIVMLHGCHQSATQFAKGTRMNHLAESKGYAVLYPQQSLSVQAHRCWRWYSPTVQEGGGEAGALVALIEMICAQHRIDRRRIYASGISAGAGMAAILALNHPTLFAAVGLHSGPVFGAGRNAIDGLRVMRHGSGSSHDAAIDKVIERHAMRSPLAGASMFPVMPAMLIHGDHDMAVHPVNQDQLTRQWLRINNMPTRGPDQRITRKPPGRGGTRNACETHDYLAGSKPIVRVVRITGLGHEWSGGDPSERFHAATGPDASLMVVSFFGKHRR
ncbi:extracellular catalytic domain type 1 short-chain-length polyhydroxyalkanoate depolymerase [Pseudoduganella violaceinigra]|uniref:extracellular catalytic domain type 1 short-chain-length polyhydroxyalkanoate depolymerase n=1 Tax=Pseudoduganella violaceinigra TaxID=246602 RepID=UPI0003FD6062|nr:PHB depolymerase family esterase [Pseudoduganella violaceinigra]